MKRILSILLTVLIFSTSVAVTASAEETMQDPYAGAENEAAVKAILPYLDQWDDYGIIDPAFSSYSVKKNGKWGLIDKKGNILVEPQYKEVAVNRYDVRILDVNDKYGYLDAFGNMLVEPKYDYADGGFSNGFAVVGRDFGYTVIDKTGREMMPLQPQKMESDLKSECFYYRNGNKVTVLDRKGKIVFEGEYELFLIYTKDTIIVAKSGKAGVINIKKDVIIKPEYDQLSFVYGVNGAVEDGVFVGVKDGNFGYFDLRGKPIGGFGWEVITNYINGNALLIKEKWVLWTYGQTGKYHFRAGLR